MVRKDARQKELRELIGRQPVANQNELVLLLRKQGFPATQASVSRDIRELGLVKLAGCYTWPDALPGGSGDGNAEYADLITGVAPVGANLIVVKTLIGAANAVAVGLDQMKLADVAGTVAGDDTFFVAIRSRAAQGRVAAVLKGLMRQP